MTIRKFVVAAVLCVVSAASFAQHASADIVYDVNLGSGSNSAIGQITTDGTFGALQAIDIKNLNLVLTAGGSSATITYSANDIFVQGSSLTATSSGLFFDFSSFHDYANLLLRSTLMVQTPVFLRTAKLK
jgi:hypothetical protein